ncbi:MAG: DUF7275 domain-containing protein [Halobacteriota archaeon]
MTLAIMGSHALNLYQFVRTPVDMDLLGTYDDCVAYIKQLGKRERIVYNVPADGGKKIIVKTKGEADKLNIYEFEIAWPDSNSEALLKLIEDDQYTWNQPGLMIPAIDILYTLKMSHRYRKDSPHFLKTMEDIHTMRKLGAKIRPEHMEWFKWREKETYNYALPKLNQSKKDFFDNSTSIYTLDHDSIHEAVKHLEKPAYEYFKPDSAEVMTSKEMFFECAWPVQLFAALEEVMVLSIERSIHPYPDVDRRWAFNMAHMKLATSISSGWFREFVWENYYTVQDMYSEEYVDKFYEALHNGRIKSFEGA